MKKQSIVMPNWIGDFTMALSVVVQKNKDRETSLTLIIPEHLISLYNSLSFISTPYIIYKRKNLFHYIGTIWNIRKHKFNIIYLLPHSFSSALLAFFCSIPNRRGIKRDRRSMLLTDVLPRSTRNSKKHIIYEYATVMETTTEPPQTWHVQRTSEKSSYRYALVFCPGANYGLSKQWLGYSQLAKIMPDRQILILGSDKDREVGENIVREAGSHCINLAGKTSLSEVVNIISQALCVVSNDSGLMHIAGFLNTPVIGIFGSTRPSWTHPIGKKSNIIYINEPCSPCFKRICRYEHYNCLNKIEPKLVLDAIDNMI